MFLGILYVTYIVKLSLIFRVVENEKLKKLTQPSQYIAELTDSNKKLKAEVAKVTSEQTQLQYKFQVSI
ncbi:hypothetical protein EON65_39390 [archaeon]|nr:MAG: hypothetical protein EON65_39390 [archaeon]